MKETDCRKCCVSDFKHALCEEDFCEKYYREGSTEDFEKLLPHWIPCTERLPERQAFYLISSKGTSWIAKWNGEYWASIFFPFVEMEDVDAWQPMPEPWKGEQQ